MIPIINTIGFDTLQCFNALIPSIWYIKVYEVNSVYRIHSFEVVGYIIASIFQANISMAIYYLVSEHFLHCNTEYTKLCHNLAFWPILNIAIYAFSFGNHLCIDWDCIYSAQGNIHCYLFSYYKHYKLYCCVIIVLLVNEYWWICNFPNFSVNYFIAIVYVFVFMNI